MISHEAADVIGSVTNLKIPMKKGEKNIDMCLAMKQIIAEENAKIIERMTKEKEEALQILKEENTKVVNKAVNEAVLLNNIQLVIDGILPFEYAVKKSGLTAEDFLKKKEEYENTLKS